MVHQLYILDLELSTLLYYKVVRIVLLFVIVLMIGMMMMVMMISDLIVQKHIAAN